MSFTSSVRRKKDLFTGHEYLWNLQAWGQPTSRHWVLRTLQRERLAAFKPCLGARSLSVLPGSCLVYLAWAASVTSVTASFAGRTQRPLSLPLCKLSLAQFPVQLLACLLLSICAAADWLIVRLWLAAFAGACCSIVCLILPSFWTSPTFHRGGVMPAFASSTHTPTNTIASCALGAWRRPK